MGYIKIVIFTLFIATFCSLTVTKPGVYLRKSWITGKRLAYVYLEYNKTLEKECEEICYKDPECEAIAISFKDEHCIFWNISFGYQRPKGNSYEFYALAKNESNYYFSDGKKYVYPVLHTNTYDGAMAECKKDFGTLVNDDSELVHEIIINFMTERNMFFAWISVSDAEHEGKWIDTKGEDFSRSKNWLPIGYWRDYDKNCAIMVLGEEYGWQMQHCGFGHYFFCEVAIFDSD